MEEVYFDNSATTKVDKQVVEAMMDMFTEDYGNPSSLHKKGSSVEKKIRNARKMIAQVLKVEEKEIIFTSGGTESNNIAVIGCAKAYQRSGKHIITTKVEHPSILNPFAYLEKEGFQVTYIDVDDEGIVKIEDLLSAIQEDTTLISVMHINNETGSINDIEQIGKQIKQINNKIIFHVDGVQSFGKAMVLPYKSHMDLFSMSSHKIHGPKGVGALYIKKGTKLIPLVTGGGQEIGYRPGTENVPGIIGFSKAVELAFKNQVENYKKVYELKKYFYTKIKENIQDIVFLGPSLEQASPYILNISFLGIRSEVLLHSLEEKGIYVSSGSACSSKTVKVSHVLKAMNANVRCMESSIRFSFSWNNTMEEAEKVVFELKNIVENLKKFYRR